MPGSITVQPGLELPASDLSWSWSRAGGPGGQHVNTTDTRARLHFTLSTCEVLTSAVKARLLAANPQWATTEGDLVLTSAEHRSRLRNIENLEQRLADAVRAALVPPVKRKKTRPSNSAKRRRLESKKRRGDVKSNRQRPTQD